MKKNYSFYLTFCTLMVSFVMSAFLTSCSDKENVLDTEDFNKKLEAFNFKTSAPVTLSVDLGTRAAKEVVAIYPTEVDEISANMHVDMLYSAFTDANGSLKTDIELPAAINKVWIVSLTKPSLGVMTAEVVDGKLTVTNNQASKAMTRAADANTTTNDNGDITTVQSDGSSLTLYNIDDYVIVHEGTITGQTLSQGYKTLSTVSKSDMGTFWCIDKWMPSSDITSTYRYGKTDNTNGLKSMNDNMAAYAEELWSQETSWATNNLNTTIKNFNASQINQHMQGDTTVVENADGSTTTTTYSGSELWVTFIREAAAYQNTFGYYIYKTDNPPTTVADGYALERIVLWPNVSKANQEPYITRTSRQTKDETSFNKTIYPKDAPLTVGERTQLLFKDPETGAVSKIFPPGYSVGFWFCADAHDPGWNTNGSSCNGLKMDYTDNLIFTQSNVRFAPWRYEKGTKTVNTYFCSSNPDINNSSLVIGNTYKSRFVQYDTTLYGEEFTLYGIEDGGNTSFNDLLFAVSRKDYHEVTNSHSEEKLVQEKYHTISTYAYEDIWPTGGDFDLNDVVIEHDQQQTYTESNKIVSVNDKFTIVLNGAEQHNAFYVQFPKGQEGNVDNLKVMVNGEEVPDRWEAETNSVIVFPDHQEAWGSGNVSVVVTRDLSGCNYEVAHLQYIPYLIANAVVDGVPNVGNGRTEIHIPGQEITSKGLKLDVDGIDTNYFASQFVSAGNEFPFAISLSGVKDWIAPEPGVRVDLTFKYYQHWRDAKGYNYMDWYYNKKGWDYRYNSGSFDANANGPGYWK